MGWLCALVWDTDVSTGHVWIVDSTPVECGRSRETAHRSDLVGWAEYGYHPSHTRWFWGLRLHLVCTLQGLPICFVLAWVKLDDRPALLSILDETEAMNPLQQEGGARQSAIGDKKLPWWRVRGHRGAGRPRAAAPGQQGRGAAPRVPILQAPAADH